ncbi:MAG: hypothetical protein BGO25_12625 [Acidobacteriales bacterium 59-55]|nr:MAG: hypothetical protein ABT04_01030 [Granulicella sp. SCN 62-9]OJV43973.1 MAG: hypothetical protein BGO25_12625 [Acidobacteriales bacterium 59-55]
MRCYLSRRDNPHQFFAILILKRVRDQQQQNAFDPSNRLPSHFALYLAILQHDKVGIVEDSAAVSKSTRCFR